MACPGIAGKKEIDVPLTRTDHTTHGDYRLDIPGGPRPAELTWVARGTTRIANHTFVPPEARGQGIAAQLVEAIVADAREQGFTIEPACSYVYALFKRHPEWADVRAPVGSD
jgi:predicted GNAT family acetyltransferase